MIRVTCTACGKKHKVSDFWAGLTAPCIKCKKPMPVPNESTTADADTAIGSYLAIAAGGVVAVLLVACLVWLAWPPPLTPEQERRKAEQKRQKAEQELLQKEHEEKVRIMEEAIDRFEKQERERKVRKQVELLDAVKKAGFLDKAK